MKRNISMKRYFSLFDPVSQSFFIFTKQSKMGLNKTTGSTAPQEQFDEALQHLVYLINNICFLIRFLLVTVDILSLFISIFLSLFSFSSSPSLSLCYLQIYLSPSFLWRWQTNLPARLTLILFEQTSSLLALLIIPDLCETMPEVIIPFIVIEVVYT